MTVLLWIVVALSTTMSATISDNQAEAEDAHLCRWRRRVVSGRRNWRGPESCRAPVSPFLGSWFSDCNTCVHKNEVSNCTETAVVSGHELRKTKMKKHISSITPYWVEIKTSTLLEQFYFFALFIHVHFKLSGILTLTCTNDDNFFTFSVNFEGLEEALIWTFTGGLVLFEIVKQFCYTKTI